MYIAGQDQGMPLVVSPVWNFHKTPLTCVGPPAGYTPVRAASALKVAAPVSGVVPPVAWVVAVVDCVVEGDVVLVVLDWNNENEQPVSNIVKEKRAASDRTNKTGLVDFTADRYLLFLFGD